MSADALRLCWCPRGSVKVPSSHVARSAVRGRSRVGGSAARRTLLMAGDGRARTRRSRPALSVSPASVRGVARPVRTAEDRCGGQSSAQRRAQGRPVDGKSGDPRRTTGRRDRGSDLILPSGRRNPWSCRPWPRLPGCRNRRATAHRCRRGAPAPVDDQPHDPEVRHGLKLVESVGLYLNRRMTGDRLAAIEIIRVRRSSALNRVDGKGAWRDDALPTSTESPTGCLAVTYIGPVHARTGIRKVR